MSAATTTRMTKEDRRQAIIEAAMAEFATAGLHGTPAEAIAQRVGVSQPYLFQLFGTKKDLFIAAVKRGFERVLAAFRAAAAEADQDADAAQVLERMGRAYAPLLHDRTLLLLQIQSYAACEDTDVRGAVREEYERLYRFVAAASGADDEALRGFFSTGMMMTVAAAMDLPTMKEDWARACMGALF
jgi:AcrR family transcriptional regulator